MDKLYEDGTDIFQVLDAIENHTGLFILNRNLDYLYSFISGYKLLAREAKIKTGNLDRLDHFSHFLKKEFDEEHENTMGWFGQLRSRYGSEEGFTKFFEYLHKCRDQNNRQQITGKQKLILFLISCDPAGLRDIYSMVKIYDGASNFPSSLSEHLEVLVNFDLIYVTHYFDNGTPNRYAATDYGQAYLKNNFSSTEIIDYIKTLANHDFLLRFTQAYLDKNNMK